MITNQASGGSRRGIARSRGRLHSTAWSRTAPPPLGRGRAVEFSTALRGDRRPGLLPHRVRDAVVAAVVAGGERRLPELDGVEVRARLVGVVLGARARL